MLYRFSTDYTTTAEAVVTDGFGQVGNNNIRALTSDGSKIYAVVENDVTGLQIWRSSTGNRDVTPGSSWTKFLADNGFGNNLNTRVDLDSSVIFWNGQIIIGAQNNSNGGGVWASDLITPYTIEGTITTTPPATLPDDITVTLQPGGLTTTVTSTLSGDGTFSFSNLGAWRLYDHPRQGRLHLQSHHQPVTITGSTLHSYFQCEPAPRPLCYRRRMVLSSNSLLPVTLSWAPVSGATKYTLVLSTSPNFANTVKSVSQAGTSYAFTGLTNGATYYWHVKVAASVLPFSNAWSVGWQFTAPIPPAAPALLTPKNGAVISTVPSTNLRPLFTWKAATVPTNGKPVEHYHLQISRQKTFDNLDLDEYTKDASPTYTPLFDLLPNQVYYWRVRAFNTSGGYSKWPTSVFSFKFQPGAVSLGDIENQDSLLRPTFHWYDDWNVGKYNLQICQRISPAKCSPFISTSVTGLAYTLAKSLLPHTSYEWKVQAVGIAGAGPWSDSNSWTSPAPPAAPSPVWPADKAIIPDATHPDFPPTLDWSDVPGASSYLVQISTDAGFFNGSTTPIPVEDDPLPSYLSADELLHNQVYYWRVSACNLNNECSVYTTTRKLTTKPDVPAPDLVEPVDNTGVYSFTWTDDNPNPAA